MRPQFSAKNDTQVMSNSIYRNETAAINIAGKYGELLRHWPVMKDESTISTRHGDTFIIASGHPDNPPLILFHGMGVNSLMWINDINTLSKSYRIYCIDTLGEPGRSASERPSLKGDAYVEWIEDIYEALGIRSAALIGISFGGYLALRFACEHPDKVSRLITLCPAGIVRPRLSFILKAVFSHFIFGSLGRKWLFRHIQGRDNLEAKNQEFFSTIFQEFKGRGSIPIIPDEKLAHLYCPKLLIVGGKDVIFDCNKILLRLARTTRELEIMYRATSGHMLTECTREIDRFLMTEFAPD
ncbi:alpha/beta hydrolase [Aurantivibrio plasticivorans]